PKAAVVTVHRIIAEQKIFISRHGEVGVNQGECYFRPNVVGNFSNGIAESDGLVVDIKFAAIEAQAISRFTRDALDENRAWRKVSPGCAEHDDASTSRLADESAESFHHEMVAR